jgi:hypothetical protein
MHLTDHTPVGVLAPARRAVAAGDELYCWMCL